MKQLLPINLMVFAVALAGAFAVCGGCRLARADVINTYTLDGVTTEGGASITGSFSIDQTTFDYSTPSGFLNSTVTVNNALSSQSDGAYTFIHYDATTFVLKSADSSTDLTLDNILTPSGTTYVPQSTGPIAASGGLADSVTSNNDLLATGSILVSSSTLADVPEPATLGLIALGLAGLAFCRRRGMGSPKRSA